MTSVRNVANYVAALPDAGLVSFPVSFPGVGHVLSEEAVKGTATAVRRL